MAIQIAVTADDFGATFPEAYARVTRFVGDKDTVNYFVLVYANAAARSADREPVMRRRYSIAQAAIGGVTFKALYDNLKTRPEFSGGVDV